MSQLNFNRRKALRFLYLSAALPALGRSAPNQGAPAKVGSFMDRTLCLQPIEIPFTGSLERDQHAAADPNESIIQMSVEAIGSEYFLMRSRRSSLGGLKELSIFYLKVAWNVVFGYDLGREDRHPQSFFMRIYRDGDAPKNAVSFHEECDRSIRDFHKDFQKYRASSLHFPSCEIRLISIFGGSVSSAVGNLTVESPVADFRNKIVEFISELKDDSN